MSSGNDNRNLYDEFGVAVSPVTGLASITYSDDQYADNTSRALGPAKTQVTRGLDAS